MTGLPGTSGSDAQAPGQLSLVQSQPFVPRRPPNRRTREAKWGRGGGVFGAGPGPELLTASRRPATWPGAAVGHLRGLFNSDIFVLQRADPATAGPSTLLVRDSAVSAAETRIANARGLHPARARFWTFRAVQRQPVSGCRPVASVPRRGPAQTWVWRKQPRRHPAPRRIPNCGPEARAGLRNVLGAEGLVASLSLCLSGKPRGARPHLHLTVIAPEARTGGDTGWPGAGTGVGAVARWDLGLEPTARSRLRYEGAPRPRARGFSPRAPVSPSVSPEGLPFGLAVIAHLYLVLVPCSEHQFTETLALAVWRRQAGHGLTSLSFWPEPASRTRRCVAGPRRRPSGPCAGPTQPSACLRVLLSLSPPRPGSRVAED